MITIADVSDFTTVGSINMIPGFELANRWNS